MWGRQCILKMATSSTLIRRVPLVVILGATGAGKSKIALEIAQKFQGEIISADSMQIYHGLDIVTNKVTPGEMELACHHMISYVNPLKNNYTIVDFKDKALPIIDDILEKRKIPIVVGGTNYYIESLIWKLLIDSQHNKYDSQAESRKSSSTKRIKKHSTSSEEGSTSQQRHIEGQLSTDSLNLQQTESVKAKLHVSLETSREKVLNCEQTEDDSSSVSQGYLNANHASMQDSDKKDITKDVRDSYRNIATSTLHEKLCQVDPAMANRLHPNNRRKIIRSLEVWKQHDMPMSEILNEQHREEGAGDLSGPLRYQDPCIIWVQCEQNVLDERCDKRVEKMMAAGLLKELKDFHKNYNQQRLKENTEVDYTHGIFQSIGFKEFHSYLLLSEEDQESELGKKLLKEGTEAMKLVTRRYARKQKKWIVSRFLKRRGLNVPTVYPVDSTVKENWMKDVYEPAVEIVSSFTLGETPLQPPIPFVENTNYSEHNICDICDGMVFVTSLDWNAHLKGRRHKKNVARKHAMAKRKLIEQQAGDISAKSKKSKLEKEQMDI